MSCNIYYSTPLGALINLIVNSCPTAEANILPPTSFSQNLNVALRTPKCSETLTSRIHISNNSPNTLKKRKDQGKLDGILRLIVMSHEPLNSLFQSKMSLFTNACEAYIKRKESGLSELRKKFYTRELDKEQGQTLVPRNISAFLGKENTITIC